MICCCLSRWTVKGTRALGSQYQMKIQRGSVWAGSVYINRVVGKVVYWVVK